MADLTPDILRARLRSAQIAVAAEIDTPSVTAVQARLHRRRQRRAVGTAVAALALVAAIGVPLWARTGDEDGTTPSVDPASATASASPSQTPTPPAPSASTAIAGAGASTSAKAHSGNGSAGCTPKGYVEVGYGTGTIILNGDVNNVYRLCPGQQLQAFWVQYEYLPDGSQVVYESHVVTLTPGHSKDESGYPDTTGVTCPGDRYVVSGPYDIVAQIPPELHDPYPGFQNYQGGAVSSTYGTACPGIVITPTDSPDATPSPAAS